MPDPIDLLSDTAIAGINAALKWDTYTLDAKGRKIGNPDGRHYPIPHDLVKSADEYLHMKGRSVVEFGCLEGAHTIAIGRIAAKVTAIDFRKDNLVKTSIRAALYGVFPTVRQLDLEVSLPAPADVYFHSGVLYHLTDPVQHLRRISMRCESLLLDTHYTKAPSTIYRAGDGREYHAEGRPENTEEIRAGARAFSHWLTMNTIMGLLGDAFSDVAVLSDRIERNGPRVTIVAKGGKGGPHA